jgi:toxin CcdB
MEIVLMARFHVYENGSQHALSTPFLMDVQADLLSDLETRVVIPLRAANSYEIKKLPKDLMPLFSIAGNEYVLETPKMAAVPARILKKLVANLKPEQNKVITAIDRLFHGF